MRSPAHFRLALCAAALVACHGARANAIDIPVPPKVASYSFAVAEEEKVTQLIIKPRQGKLAGALHDNDAEALSTVSSVRMTVVRPMSGDAHVVRLDSPVSLSEAMVIAARLVKDGVVELAEPDLIVRPFTYAPNDPLYGMQWHYHAAGAQNAGGANLSGAWAVTRGRSQVTVAVLDTGILPHADLGAVLPGYDFISNTFNANDGNGRDSDPSDPGDATGAGECGDGRSATASTWHGTHVAGTIAATMNNNTGVTGIAPDVRILPVRVLGKCGGYTSDIVDAMRWAAGLPVTGVPANPAPAHVLNLSLGSRNTCSNAFQGAVNDVINAGKVVVAAAGNEGSAVVSQPANCMGVLGVTAHAVDGDNANYANIGPEVAISAPGGGCGTNSSVAGTCNYEVNGLHVLSLGNTGTTAPAADRYTSYRGTSMATPHVAGGVALMLSVSPSLTPAQVRSHLLSSARPHPAGSACATAFAGKCGAGLLDGEAALYTLLGPSVALARPAQVVAPNALVALSGIATASTGRTITAYSWKQVSGDPVGPIANADTPNASISAGTTGTASFELTVTDSAGQTGKAIALVRVNSAPVLSAVGAQTFAAGASASFQLAATDADGDRLIFHGIDLPAGASLSAAGAFSWPMAQPGRYAVTYYASDEYAESVPGSVDITITSAGGSGGGGSMGGAPLLVLAALAAARRVHRLLARR